MLPHSWARAGHSWAGSGGGEGEQQEQGSEEDDGHRDDGGCGHGERPPGRPNGYRGQTGGGGCQAEDAQNREHERSRRYVVGTRQIHMVGRVLTGVAALVMVGVIVVGLIPLDSCGSVLSNLASDSSRCTDRINTLAGRMLKTTLGAFIVGLVGLSLITDTYRKL